MTEAFPLKETLRLIEDLSCAVWKHQPSERALQHHRSGQMEVKSMALTQSLGCIRLLTADDDLMIFLNEDGAVGNRCLALVSRGEPQNALNVLAGSFQDSEIVGSALMPSSDIALHERLDLIMDAAIGAVAGQDPTTSFASSSIDWSGGTPCLSIGCDKPIGHPQRPAVPEKMVEEARKSRPPARLVVGNIRKTLEPFMGGAALRRRQREVMLHPHLEKEIELDIMSRMRCIAAGRAAWESLGFPDTDA